MKIAFMGGACSGKTTLIQQFLKRWPQYTTSLKTYRDIIKEKNLSINKDGNKDNQSIILDSLIEEINLAKDVKDIVFDRCVIDNIVYSLWLYNNNKVTDDFIVTCKYKIREAVSKYDIIFYAPRDKDIAIVEKENRETDIQYINEIDNIYNAVVSSYERGLDIFFPLENCPAVITLNTKPDTRCDMISLYLRAEGSLYDEKDSDWIYR
jgi:predicted ATPase